MMDESDRLDDMIDEAAREYNRAPETPSAEMWARIQAGRTRRGAIPVAPVTSQAPATQLHGTRPTDGEAQSRPDIVPIHVTRRRPMWWAAGLAATLMLGVAIGRMSLQKGGVSPGGTTGPTTVATAPVPQSATLPTATSGAGDTSASSSGSGSTPTSTTAPSGGALAVAPNGAPRSSGSGARGDDRQAARVGLPYQLATGEHLAMTEALLVTLRADMKAGRRDTTVASWATNLLGTTRMLLDSPASKDAQMKKLLEDLELVLAQIARLPAASGDSTDLELIDRAVKQRQVLTRLRAIAPRT
jgi:hypothetical protein